MTDQWPTAATADPPEYPFNNDRHVYPPANCAGCGGPPHGSTVLDFACRMQAVTDAQRDAIAKALPDDPFEGLS